MLGEAKTNLYAGRPPYSDKRGKVLASETGGATLLVRRKAEDTTFVALHEPFEGGMGNLPATRFERIAQDNAKGLAVRITGDGAVNDRVLMQFGDDLTRAVTLRDGSESFTFRDYAYLRISGDSVEVFGNVTAMKLKVPGSPKLTLNGKKTDATVAGGYMTFGAM